MVEPSVVVLVDVPVVEASPVDVPVPAADEEDEVDDDVAPSEVAVSALDVASLVSLPAWQAEEGRESSANAVARER
ncbi:MAG TPA: hypothetical protein PKW35_08255 [Nannocystaceae bacterium]|nr:hypothetical protein [Nannocystaceae bacterium]